MEQINIEFWKKVQSDFLLYPTIEFLCWASSTFENVWNDSSDKDEFISHLAEEFLQEKKITEWRTDHTCPLLLFEYANTLKPYTEDLAREIRLQFLQWIIEKLEKETLI